MAAALLAAGGAGARRDAGYADAAGAREAYRRAQLSAEAAERRGRHFERQARQASDAADRAEREAAALAARIQQAEAAMVAANARLTLIEGERRVLARNLAQRQGPLIRLIAALQRMTRRPLVLSVLRPKSLRETVYLQAALHTTMPRIRARTAGLREQIRRSEALEKEARLALAELRNHEAALAGRRRALAALEARQRLASRGARGAALRQEERALALAEEARDLDALVERFDEAARLRAELAALPGPILRPRLPEKSRAVSPSDAAPQRAATAPPADYQLPVSGRPIAGFGARNPDGSRNRGLSLAPPEGAIVVAPAAGKVAFAGPYRGYGGIVIIEHPGGWTSLVTGLSRTTVKVGAEIVTGAPLGNAAKTRPVITLELRRRGESVNPLAHL